jgi:hypothetical protein
VGTRWTAGLPTASGCNRAAQRVIETAPAIRGRGERFRPPETYKVSNIGRDWAVLRSAAHLVQLLSRGRPDLCAAGGTGGYALPVDSVENVKPASIRTQSILMLNLLKRRIRPGKLRPLPTTMRRSEEKCAATFCKIKAVGSVVNDWRRRNDTLLSSSSPR